jgi:hypothetical protein
MVYNRFSFITCLIIASFLIAPVAAVSILTDFPVIHMYLEQDGSPYTANSSLSITCFGYVCAGNDCRESVKERVNTTGFMVFSGVCPSYGCTFYRYGEIGELYSRRHYSRCDLQINSTCRNSTIAGYADRPYTNCSIISSSWARVLTPEYFTCMDHEDDERIQCVHDNTSSDAALIGSCWDTYNRNIGSCKSNWTYPNPSIPEWRGEGFPPRPATEICDMHFTLPSENQTPVIQPSPDRKNPTAGHVAPVSSAETDNKTAGSPDPIESLYCSILNFIGARC